MGRIKAKLRYLFFGLLLFLFLLLLLLLMLLLLLLFLTKAGNARKMHHLGSNTQCTVIYLGSFIQRNAPDDESDDPFSDRLHQ